MQKSQGCLLLGLMFFVALTANVTKAQETSSADKDNSAPLSIIEPTATAGLNNRFRIDYMVENITLLIKRRYQSVPVILLLPDGTKWYSDRHPDTVHWVDGIASDIIVIKNPMPGPWQVLGHVNQGSSIEKLSELSVEVDPLPEPIFQGERVKVTARLLSGEKLMTMPGMDYLINWQAKLLSNQQAGDENFAVGTYKAGGYLDNGEMLDERPDDGLFTGDLNLNQPWGHYTFQVMARNRILEREFNIPLNLLPQPVKVTIVEPSDTVNGQWRVNIFINEEHVRAPETHVELTVVGPSEQWPLPLTVLVPGNNLMDIPKMPGPGGYRIEGSIASTTVGGREIVLTMNEQFFSIADPVPEGPSLADIAKEEAKIADAQTLAARSNAQFWIITINVILLVLGIIGLIVWRKRQTMAKALASAELNMLNQPATNAKSSTGAKDIKLAGKTA
ncbi:TIGR03503 family protein [Shewanella sp. SNU WT4]|uniref:TIGR03503 family protein n=1 Tax=Shewanella sp. SNU WT4 TaxID=2590015 RepID=UPI001127A095|nr:TIGR03503 family protein [Shewanella sp. SNU WT4]QDF66968.1 TIGR03503 family protein [Shewanella sp. SNU WT4]